MDFENKIIDYEPGYFRPSGEKRDDGGEDFFDELHKAMIESQIVVRPNRSRPIATPLNYAPVAPGMDSIAETDFTAFDKTTNYDNGGVDFQNFANFPQDLDLEHVEEAKPDINKMTDDEYHNYIQQKVMRIESDRKNYGMKKLQISNFNLE